MPIFSSQDLVHSGSGLVRLASSMWVSGLLAEHRFPVTLHIHDYPAFGEGLAKGLVESPDRGLPITGPFVGGVCVMHQPHEPRAAARGGPLQHLVVTVGIAEGK